MTKSSPFWNQLAESLNSGWAIDVPVQDNGTPRVMLSSMRHFVYAFDTAKSWILCGGVSNSEVLRCAEQMRSAPEDIRNATHDAAKRAIVEAADAGMGHDDPRSREVMTATLAAITLTQTYATMMPAPEGAALHWVYVIYRMRDGSTTSRPICIPMNVGKAGGALLDPHHLFDTLVQVTSADTSPRSTSGVANMLRMAGGALLDKNLRREVSQLHMNASRGTRR